MKWCLIPWLQSRLGDRGKGGRGWGGGKRVGMGGRGWREGGEDGGRGWREGGEDGRRGWGWGEGGGGGDGGREGEGVRRGEWDIVRGREEGI